MEPKHTNQNQPDMTIGEAGRDTPARGTVCGPTIAQDRRDAQLAEFLVVRHEHWVTKGELAVPDPFLEANPCGDAQELATDFQLLDDCLRQLEQARREKVLNSADQGCNSITSTNNAKVGRLKAEQKEFSGTGAMEAANVAHCDHSVRRIGRFEVLRELGRGGLGVVLLAYDPVLRREVALKIPRPEALLTPDLRRRFQHEAHAAARLTHPNIVPVFEVGEAGPICFIAGEFIEGTTLAHWLKERGRPIRASDAAAIAADLADAMHYAHGQGVLHRDLKPGNVLLTLRKQFSVGGLEAEGCLRSWDAKVTDFGLAKVLDLAGTETRTGAILGTPSYMSPEQAKGQREVGPATDVYALGAILYELLAGRPPFSGHSDVETLSQVVSDEPPPLRRLLPEIPRDLEAICLVCLEKSPDRRYQSASDLSADLRRFIAGEPTNVRPLSSSQRLLRWARRRPAQAALGVVTIAALLTIGVGLYFYTSRLNQALTLAKDHANRAESSQQIAKQHEELANEQLYVTQMRLADLATREGNLTRARQLLEPYGPGRPMAHLRGVEWQLLKHQLSRIANAGSESSTTILAHPDEVYTAQFAPDGRRLVTGSQDGHLRIWDPDQNRLLYDILAHDQCINQIRFSPDGRKVVTSSCDKTAKVWQVHATAAPELMYTLGHESPVRYIVFSPDGLQFATLADSKQITADTFVGPLSVWNSETGGRVFHSEAPGPNDAGGLVWSLDGRYLTCCRSGLVTTITTADWQPHFSKSYRRCQIANHPPSGRLSAFEEGSVHEIDLDKKTDRLSLETMYAEDFTWSSDARFLAISDSDGIAHLFDAQNVNRAYHFYQHHDRRVAELTFSPKTTQFATAGFDRRVCVTNLTTRLDLLPTAKHAFPDHGPGTITACDGDCKRFTRLGGGAFLRLEPHSLKRPDTKSAVASGASVDVPSKYRTLAIPTLNPAIWKQLSPGGTRGVWVYTDKLVVIADLEHESTFELPFESSQGTLRAYVFDQRPIVFLIDAYIVRVVEWTTSQELFRGQIDSAPTSDMYVALSPDGRYLLIVNSPLSIQIADLTTGKIRVVSGQGQTSKCPSFSPDGRSFSVIRGDTTVEIWDTETVTRRHFLQPRQRPLATAFSADSRTLAIASRRDLTLWHTRRGQEMVGLSMPSEPTLIRFARDGSKFVWFSDNSGTAEIFEWNLEQD